LIHCVEDDFSCFLVGCVAARTGLGLVAFFAEREVAERFSRQGPDSSRRGCQISKACGDAAFFFYPGADRKFRRKEGPGMSGGTRRQKSITLVVALIFLALITLLATSALSTTNTNLKVVGNMQARGEALDAAQQAIEAVIGSPRFLATPADAVLKPCETANTLCTDSFGRHILGDPERA
jgi:hypothetical protein